MYRSQEIRLFAEADLDEYLLSKRSYLESSIENEPENYILKVNEEEYVGSLVDQYSVSPLEIMSDDVTVDDVEREISASNFPRDYYVEPGKTYTKTAFRFYLPFHGDPELLRLSPNKRLMWSQDVEVEGNNICFEFLDFQNDANKIRSRKDGIVDKISRQAAYVNEQVASFNDALAQWASSKLTSRKNQILKKRDLVSSLGVPVRRRDDTADTFSIKPPGVRPKIRVEKPSVQEEEYVPEPSLDDVTYRQIIQLINDVGRQFERMPSTYSGKAEEDLRDHILLFLEPNFEGSATGETFNKTGKTDILLRHEGSNVFVAECKFWSGRSAFLDTISQLLGYLTWRDSKASIILFVRNKDFTSVLNQIPDACSEHENYLRYQGSIEESWFDIRFHLNGDPSREVKTAVLLYHIPNS